jgi:iron-sulfur cluster repair protein YtfE (RIC family)
MNPAATFSYEEVRAQIFAQHDELLRLLRTAGALASAAAGGDGVCREEVPRFLDTLMGKLHAHLDYEAANLVPLLEGGEAAERTAAARLRETHALQHEELTRLAHLVWSPANFAALPSAIDVLRHDMRADIAQEEKALLARAPLGTADEVSGPGA